VFGLLLYLRVLYTTWTELGRVLEIARHPSAGEKEQMAALYARALRTALAGNLVAGVFLSQAYSAGLWMLVATSVTLVRIMVPTPPSNTSVAPNRTASPATISRDRN
jgi:hypothetical protein